MKTVAIISEYNPFHSGHLYQIQRIREEFGEDTRIVAIMSGNYTQRGHIAFMDKSARAKMAVLEGVNLVLELPFPYSCASAELFAKAPERLRRQSLKRRKSLLKRDFRFKADLPRQSVFLIRLRLVLRRTGQRSCRKSFVIRKKILYFLRRSFLSLRQSLHIRKAPMIILIIFIIGLSAISLGKSLIM